MPSLPPGQVILLPSAMVHRHQLKMRKRKVKIAVAGACLAGILASLLAIAIEPSESDPSDGGEIDISFGDESPFRPSSGEASDFGESEAWFTATGGGQHSR